MRRLIYSYFISGLLLLCASCSTKQYQVLFQQKDKLNDSSYANVDTMGSYRIKPQDILQIRNLQDSNVLLSSTTSGNAAKSVILAPGSADNLGFQVEEAGTVILPALGRIKVAGYTRAEAQKLIEDAYRKNVLVNPIIELKIISLKVTIFGEIKSQGSFPLIKEHTTLVEMLGTAGGITEKANETNIKIIRGTGKNPKVIVVDLGDIQSINDPKTMLQNGDIIYIAQNKRATRNDNFQNFSASFFQPVLLLFNTALIIFTLVRH
ncbi:polysaccharide biosynthesis/export family protein [Mucilaginibacter sp. BJC16-A38]|uniref:polysaccharide biosynthesis/export family protein n=1 Tax=Mucilaginibacter phenanthrenivorans TaxID=1234842 RepID=UPI002157C74F|nr:polysaccharide biosynthesis/export family protein [Mucilaginibacter phenanthrenivorans]MCR8560204.1 polysaccharide biosynthesis/export family protein [Mucilaginibacter phenanthrenivorans]